jgi:hypothetical protein
MECEQAHKQWIRENDNMWYLVPRYSAHRNMRDAGSKPPLDPTSRTYYPLRDP